MFNFTDKIVLVTGASGNLGGAMASAFAAAGAKLALPDRKTDRLPSLFPDLSASPDHLFLSDFDATDPDSVQATIEQIIAHFGRIDVLANAIGGYRAGTPVHETSLQTWDFMHNLNARSAFILSRAVVPHMLTQGRGKIVHTSARAAERGSANAAAYSASKTAIVRLVESLSAEVKANGINVNCVLPGTIDTPENRAAMPNADHSRWVSPAAIADVVLFLASDAARAVHGAAVPVYGLS